MVHVSPGGLRVKVLGEIPTLPSIYVYICILFFKLIATLDILLCMCVSVFVPSVSPENSASDGPSYRTLSHHIIYSQRP